MNYYDNPPDPVQNSPLEPHNIVSGALPGATEIRLGGSIKISGKNQQIKVTTTGGNITMGATSDGRLAVEVTNADGSKTGIGVIPGSTDLGFYTLNTAGAVIQKIVGNTSYIYDNSGNLTQKTTPDTTFVYDITNNKNVMQERKLPDGTYGWAIAATGSNVSDGYS